MSSNIVDTTVSKFDGSDEFKEECFYHTLPGSVLKRVFGLKALQNEHHKLETEFHNEILALERKFAEKYQPLYNKRAAIISGEVEPTSEQIDAGKKMAEEEEEEGALENSPKPDIKEIKGIPEFWLTCFKNNPCLAELITERDEEALEHLINVETVHLADDTGYTLIFTFSENEFFTNTQLTKTYFFKNAEPTGAIVVERSTCTEVDWKEGKNLTMTLKARKQRKKGSNETKVVKMLEPTQSFFSFFSPKDPPSEESDDDQAAEEYEEMLSLDFSLAETIKDKIVLHAVDWYTGLAQGYEDAEMDENEYDNMGYDGASSDEEERSEESEVEIDVREKKEVGPECKQQ